MNNNDLLIKVKSVYGVKRIYPVCDRSKAFSKLLGKKTLSRYALGIIAGELKYNVINKTEDHWSDAQ